MCQNDVKKHTPVFREEPEKEKMPSVCFELFEKCRLNNNSRMRSSNRRRKNSQYYHHYCFASAAFAFSIDDVIPSFVAM